MMNLSMSHPVPTFGDSFTITCYVCGMPSSKEWAQKARSRPTTPHKPYFPFLLQISPIGGAILREDGSTYLCAFCHASLEAQWSIYESQQVIPPANRKYNIQKFICAVCGVETYRKRIRALPFQEFPFLEKQRQVGSITLGNNPLAVVCLDCSETLWAQSAEYDRWGLPVHKRHFNWMARPPPPEDSVEATVARLPSGETQLPRCPPTEPSIAPSKIVVESSTPSAAKISDGTSSKMCRGGKTKADSPKLQENPHHNFSSPGPSQTSSRKTSMTSTTPPSMDLVGGFHNQQPPVVTVAPMSNHTTVISLRKDSLQLPSGLLPPHHPQVGPVGMFPGQSTTAVYQPAASYASYVWGNTTREPGGQRPQIEAYPTYGSPTEAMAAAGPWPWLPHPASSDLLRYQSYVSSLQNRSRMVEGSVSSTSPAHTSPARSSSSPSVPYGAGANALVGASSTIVSGVSPVTLREHERIILEEQRQVAAINSERRSTTPGGGNAGGYEISGLVYQRKGSPDPAIATSVARSGGKKSPKILTVSVSSTDRDTEKAGISTPSGGSNAASKLYPSHPKKVKETVSETVPREVGASSSRSESEVRLTPSSPSRSAESASGGGAAGGGEEEERVYRREFHIPKKRNWHVFMKENQSTSSTPTLQSEGIKEKSESPPPQVVHHPKKKKSSLSECSVEGPTKSYGETTLLKEKDDAAIKYPPQRSSRGATSTSSGDSAMDLSVTTEPKSSEQTDLKGGGGGASNFRIEYLCQSTTTTRVTEEVSGGGQPTSVIRCAPKVPPTSHDNRASTEEDEGEVGATSIISGNEETGDGERKERTASIDDDHVKKTEMSKNLIEERQTSKDVEHAGMEVVLEGNNDDDDRNKEGKSEKQAVQEGSTMNSVDDDDKHEDLPNIEQFIKETVLELVSREKTRDKVAQEVENEQKQFLHELGLITPDKKIDLEIKSIVSRHERKTLPPLQLRADTKLGRKIDKQLKELLLKVSLQDPTLFEETPEAEKSDFMKELGMKTAQRSEKTRREIKWRVILMERMRRELRNCAARGVKHEWEKSEILKKFASCDLDSFFNSLSYAALKQTSEEELLVEKKEVAKVGTSKVTEERDLAGGSGSSGATVCINYPKYIPSYATARSSEGGNSLPSSSEEDSATSTPPPTAHFTDSILKIPVVSPTKTRRQSESSSNSDAGDTGLPSSANEEVKFIPSSIQTPYPLRIDNLIQYSTSYWKQMKRSVDEILTELESSKEDIPLEDKTAHFDKLRKHLKSQLSDIKEIEKRFRQTGKAILSSSRTARNTTKKSEQQKTKDN